MFRKPRKPVLLQTLLKNIKQKMEFSSDDFGNGNLSSSLSQNLDTVKNQLHDSPDLTIREFMLDSHSKCYAAIVFIDGLVDKNQIEESILTPLMLETAKINGLESGFPDLFSWIETHFITVGNIKRLDCMNDALDAILSGNTVLLMDGYAKALNINTPGWEKRNIEEPTVEVVSRGPRLGFTENIRTNTAMLRLIIGSPELVFENVTVGRKTRTFVSVAYLKGVIDEDLIPEIRLRLKRICTDSVQGDGFVEQFIEDAPLSPFSTVGYTERPDVAAAKILEGRAAILVDGSPVVLTVPLLFIEYFQVPDDYTLRPYYQTVVRWIRYIAFFFSIFSPAIYVALTAFHQELLPTPLLITMAAATEGTPFPAVIEALGMGLVFEILREAGIRLPRPIGQTVSFVGALVVGQATVSAGLVGAPIVIVVAMTAIASFVNPKLADVSAIIRFAMTILAGFMGAFGIIFGFLLGLIHLTSLRSFGVSYLTPISPTILSDLKDVFIRTPVWAMKNRPKALHPEDLKRQATHQMPHPPSSSNRSKPKNGDVI